MTGTAIRKADREQDEHEPEDAFPEQQRNQKKRAEERRPDQMRETSRDRMSPKSCAASENLLIPTTTMNTSEPAINTLANITSREPTSPNTRLEVTPDRHYTAGRFHQRVLVLALTPMAAAERHMDHRQIRREAGRQDVTLEIGLTVRGLDQRAGRGLHVDGTEFERTVADAGGTLIDVRPRLEPHAVPRSDR